MGINQANIRKFIFGIHTWTSYLPFEIYYCFNSEKQKEITAGKCNGCK